MDGDLQSDHLTGTVANGSVSNEARAGGATGNWIPTQEKASNNTSHDRNEERSLTASFDKLNLSEIIDAVSKARYSSCRLAPSISEVPLAPGPSAQTHSVPTTASIETSQSQLDLARRFNPLVTTISLLGGKKPDSRVSYEAVKSKMTAKRQEMESLGWPSFERILEVASQAKAVLVLNSGGKKFLQLPPPPPLVHRPLNVADYPLEHRALVSTMIKLTDGRPGAGKSTVELANALKQSCPRLEGDYFLIARAEECGVLRIRRSTPVSVWAYLNQPVARTSTISQPPSIASQSLPGPAQAQIPPTQAKIHGKKTAQMSKPVQSPSPPNQPAKPTSPQSPTASTSDASNPLPLPAKQRLIKVLTRLTQGAPRGFADVDEVMRLLRLEYPWAKDEFLLSMIRKAEEENLVVRERDQESKGLVRLEGPQARPSGALVQQNLHPNRPNKPQMVHPEPSRYGIPKPIAKQSAPFGVAKDVKPTTTGSSSKPKPIHNTPSETSMKPKPVPPKPNQCVVVRKPQPPASQSILAKDVKPAAIEADSPSAPPKSTHVEPSKPAHGRNKSGYYVVEHDMMPKSGGGWWY